MERMFDALKIIYNLLLIVTIRQFDGRSLVSMAFYTWGTAKFYLYQSAAVHI